jgi:hypothetical protein
MGEKIQLERWCIRRASATALTNDWRAWWVGWEAGGGAAQLARRSPRPDTQQLAGPRPPYVVERGAINSCHEGHVSHKPCKMQAHEAGF